MMNILSLEDLQTTLAYKDKRIVVCDHINLELKKNEILGLVGESGCGKTMACLSLTGVVPKNALIRFKNFSFDGCEIDYLDQRILKELRINGISYIFQESEEYINPLFSIGDQIAESISFASRVTKSEAAKEALELLERVGLNPAKEYYSRFIHELSGGQNQRAMIALALSTSPKVLIADEPTTALDVSIQRAILNLIRQLVKERGISVIWITHDISLISNIVDRLFVMYAARIVEEGDTQKILKMPAHPYTQALLSCLPERLTKKRFIPISGEVADLSELPSGCKFHPRCPYRMDVCLKQEPSWTEVRHGQKAKCYLLQKA
jgi:oligopeptide/dipeptide ABC transporter ATP-binding protein